MEKIKVLPLRYKFHSIKNLYKGFRETDIDVEIYEYGTDTLEVKLINTNFDEQRWALKKQFLFLFISFCIYGTILFVENYHLAFIDMILIIWLLPLICRLNRLVEFEKFVFCYGFGIHLQIQKIMGNQNRFVATSHIHDIVINEVLENLDFRHLIILRTKGKLFYKNPIIPIFKEFQPSYECLTVVYKHLRKVILKS